MVPLHKVSIRTADVNFQENLWIPQIHHHHQIQTILRVCCEMMTIPINLFTIRLPIKVTEHIDTLKVAPLSHRDRVNRMQLQRLRGRNE